MKEYKNKIKKDKTPLWSYLGIDKNFPCKNIDKIYSSNGLRDKQAQLAWKILRDKYFSSEYKKNKSTERIFESGFFDDELNIDFFKEINYLWPKTPLYKINNNLNKVVGKKKCAVLLSTGAFSPIHRGHILYMDAAKKELSKRGICVLGGYISPSHDGYVDFKDGGRAKMNAKYRLRLCREAVRNSGWLMADGWESVGVVAPVTYTLVYERLKKYLSFRFAKSVEIDLYFVVGSDNAAYVRSFAKNGYCVCVERYNYSKTYKQILEEYKNYKNIIFVDYKKEHLKCSSVKIRRGDLSMMKSNTRKNFIKYLNSK
jgi:nicotinic acid mononucleotide adenylyltransferase